MKQKKQSKFFMFIFSFIPGAAEMYMGFMKSGISIMALFIIVLMLSVSTRGMRILGCINVLFWFYAFFHARNYAKADDETFGGLYDDYVWNEFFTEGTVSIPDEKVRKWGAVVLIIIGCWLLWGYASDLLLWMIPDDMWDQWYPVISNIPQAVISVLFILGGAKLIRGRRQSAEELMPDEATVIKDEGGTV